MATLNDDLVLQLRDAFKRDADVTEDVERGRAVWVEIKWDAARLLLEARQRWKSNNEFHRWLGENELLYFGDHDRAALLNIAQHEALFRETSARTQSTSVRLVWREMESRLDSAVKTDPPGTPRPEVDESAPVAENTAASAPLDVVAEVRIEPPKASKQLLGRSPLKALPQADLVLRYLKDADTRSMLGKAVTRRGGKLCWALLVEAITSGAFGPPSEASVSRPNLRLILPWAPMGFSSRFDLLDADTCARIRQNILPVVLASGEALRRDPSRFQEAVATHVRARAADAQERRQATERAAAVSALPVDEQPILVYGTPIWPWTLTSTAAWTYDEALTAAWFFRAIHGYLVGTPHERAVIINLMLRWARPAHRTGWAHALRAIGQAYERNPEGENRYAPPPINFGE